MWFLRGEVALAGAPPDNQVLLLNGVHDFLRFAS